MGQPRRRSPSPTRTTRPTGQRVGYARVSTVGQSLDEQRDKLARADCNKVFEEKLSGKKRDRPELDRKGVDFIVLDQPQIDTTSPLGRLLFAVLGAVASFERDLIFERTEEGKARARAKGVRFGRTPKLAPQRLAELHQRFAAGDSRGILSREFGITRSSVYRLCQHITQSAHPAPAPHPQPRTRKKPYRS